MTHLVFVYGSLRAGHYNHGLLKGSTCLSNEALYVGGRMHSLGAFPAVVKGVGAINGELYEVDEETFSALDRLEGHPTFYKREKQIINLKGVDEREAWVYLFQEEAHLGPHNLVDTGDWSDVRTPTSQACA